MGKTPKDAGYSNEGMKMVNAGRLSKKSKKHKAECDASKTLLLAVPQLPAVILVVTQAPADANIKGYDQRDIMITQNRHHRCTTSSYGVFSPLRVSWVPSNSELHPVHDHESEVECTRTSQNATRLTR